MGSKFDNPEADLPPIGRDGYIHRIEWQGQRLTWQTFQLPQDKRKQGKKQQIQDFSQASRYRMLLMVNSIDWHEAGHCQFLTLTYPDHYYNMERVTMGIHRSMFWRYMEEIYEKKISAIWRIEWMPRKTGKWVGHLMPHVHMVVFRIKRMWDWDVYDRWQRAIGWDHYVDTKVESMKTPKQVGIYVSKYCGKVSPRLGIASYPNKIPAGRAWGMLRKECFPLAKTRVGVFKRSAMTEYIQQKVLQHHKPFEWYGQKSFTLLGPIARLYGQELFRDWVDGEIPSW